MRFWNFDAIEKIALENMEGSDVGKGEGKKNVKELFLVIKERQNCEIQCVTIHARMRCKAILLLHNQVMILRVLYVGF